MMAKKEQPSFPEPPQPKGYYVGTSGWTYDIWQPGFYPEGLSKTKFLSYYASRLTACEVNYTFRNRLSEKTALKWIAETPQSFRFVCKAHQFITHIRRLRDCTEPVRNLATGMEPLFNAGRLGAVLFQLPPNLKADSALLRDFLQLLPKWMKAAFEFRHESWFSDETYKVLADSHAALCIAESDELTTPDTQTTSFVYYRFRESAYSAEDLEKLAKRLKTVREKSDAVYAFFKHDERPESPLHAADVLTQVLK